MSEVFLFVVGLLLTCATGIFVAAEFSLVSLNKGEIQRQLDLESDSKKKRQLSRLSLALTHTSTHLSSAQLGITLTTLLAGYTFEPALSAFFSGIFKFLWIPEEIHKGISLVLAVLFATFLSMIIGELIPKNLAIALPQQTAQVVVAFQIGFSRVFSWPVRMLNASANALLRAVRIEPQEELSAARTAEELSSLVKHSAIQGTLEQDTATLLDRVFRFQRRVADEVMTPRPRMVTVQRMQPVSSVLDMSAQTGFSRFPVIDDDRDDVVGIVHLKYAVALPRNKRREVPVAALAEEITRIPHTLPLDLLLTQLRDARYQCAVVVDEYGGTAGFITLEDLVEELVGEVADEHDKVRAGINELKNSVSFPGELRPDEIREQANIDIPEHPAYDTVAGFLLYTLGEIPKQGDRVELADGSSLFVEHMDGMRVSRLRYVRGNKPEQTVNGQSEKDSQNHLTRGESVKGGAV